MVTKSLFAAVVLVPVIGWALPGDVVTAIAPRFDARASESVVALDTSGVIHLWAGAPPLDGSEIAALDGTETGGIIRLTADGTTAAVLAPELLQAGKNQGIPLSPWVVFRSDLRFLTDGRLMVCTPDRGGVLVTPDGVASSGFFKNLPITSRVSPQFERGGYFYFIIYEMNGSQMLAKQAVAATEWSPEVLSSEDWPLPPGAAVAGPNQTIRVLGTSGPYADGVMSFTIRQRIFLIDESGQLVVGAPVYDPAVNRPASLTASGGGGYRLVFGDDPQRFSYWPSPQNSSYRVEWRDEANGLLRAMNFVTPLMPFTFAEGAGGEVVATGPDGTLQRFSSAGVEDPDFTSPGGASSALSLPGGKWLINGTRRILADGTADPSWHIPNRTRPASFSHLVSASDGGLLAAGEFSGVVKLAADGTPFPGFAADSRLGKISALAVMPDDSVVVYLPSEVVLGDGRRSKLVRLRADGSLDESLFPPVVPPGPVFLVNSAVQLLASQADGKLLVVTVNYGGEVTQWTLSRLLPDLTADPSFTTVNGFGGWPTGLLALPDGRIFVGSRLLDADGRALINLDSAEYISRYAPLCLMPDGAVIFADGTGTGWQLRRWRNGGWDEGFFAAVPASWYGIGACPGPSGKLYVWANSVDGTAPSPQVMRLHRNGRVDASFRAPLLARHARRGPGPWLTFNAEGIVPFDPASEAVGSRVNAGVWVPGTNRVWLAGSFNMADRFASDGLVVVEGESVAGYPAWSQAALRSLPNAAAPELDPDSDGCSNFLEYATGSDPLAANVGDGVLQPLGGQPLWFGLWKNPEAPELYPVIKVSENLSDWRTANGAEISLDSTGSRVMFGLLPGGPKRFARVDFIAP